MIKFRSKTLKLFLVAKTLTNCLSCDKNVDRIVIVKKNVDQMKEYRAQNLNLNLY